MSLATGAGGADGRMRGSLCLVDVAAAGGSLRLMSMAAAAAAAGGTRVVTVMS